MSNLKLLRTRIKSVKSTQKITKAMKMVAAAKLRRAKENAEAARPYADAMANMLSSLAVAASGNDNAPKLLIGNGKSDTHLIVVATSDRGLCGGFNSSIARATRRKVRELENQGRKVKLFYIGRKGYDQLLLEFSRLEAGKLFDISKKKIAYSQAESVAKKLINMFEAGEVDTVSVVYNKFKSAISQEVTFQQLIPLEAASGERRNASEIASSPLESHPSAPYEYEPSENAVLETLLPKNVGVQLFKALLENAASEQGARMSAMDSATRNAGEMIKKLTLKYNRSRQAAITKELIEIISGAEAV
jgi:F-type H+-transporting ATPase subunit gamma